MYSSQKAVLKFNIDLTCMDTTCTCVYIILGVLKNRFSEYRMHLICLFHSGTESAMFFEIQKARKEHEEMVLKLELEKQQLVLENERLERERLKEKQVIEQERLALEREKMEEIQTVIREKESELVLMKEEAEERIVELRKKLETSDR